MPNLGPHLLQRLSCPLSLSGSTTAATPGTQDQPVPSLSPDYPAAPTSPVPSLSKFIPHLLRGMECGRFTPGG